MANIPIREQILTIANGLPSTNLVKYLKDGIISIEDLQSIGLPESKIEEVEQKLIAEEQKMWEAACSSGRMTDFYRHLKTYPNGVFAEACRQALSSGEEEFWAEVMEKGTIPMLQQYLEVYEVLGGEHVYECQDMLADPDWILVKKNPNLANIKAYEENHPGAHSIEIAEMRATLTDEVDWSNSLYENNIAAFQRYLDLHPQGNHADEAQQRIEAAAGHEQFMREMASDPNRKLADEIKIAVANNVITWDDVMRIYGRDRTMAIQNFNGMVPLDVNGRTPAKLMPNSTEVYFWGTPSSGKTCALGSLLSGAENFYKLEAQQCQGYNYMTRLKNVFHPNRICSLPPGTRVDDIQEMVFTIVDDRFRKHTMTFIDLAGEIFRAIFYDMNNMFLSDQHVQTLRVVKSFLQDKTNPKIHFFVVEYGAENKIWEGLLMKDYLSACSLYIKDNNILKYSAGVYILVTKCDKIGCPDDMIVDLAEQYVQNNLPAFYYHLRDAAVNAGIDDFQVIPFSIGEVFAGQLCNYDDSFIDDVIEVLLAKTRAQKKSKLDWLKQ